MEEQGQWPDGQKVNAPTNGARARSSGSHHGDLL